MIIVNVCYVFPAIFDNPAASDTEWIKFNHDHTGYYRVNYPLDMWAAIAEQLSTSLQVSYSFQLSLL